MQKYAIQIGINTYDDAYYDVHIDDCDENTLLWLLTDIVNDRHLKRGDVIRYSNNRFHNPERYFWDGEKVIGLQQVSGIDFIPHVFSCPEFSPTYFHDVVTENNVCNIDLSLREQIKSNMLYGVFPKTHDGDWPHLSNKVPPNPNPYPHHIAYSWFNQDIKWLDSNRYDEIKNAIVVSCDVPDVLSDLIMQFMGKTCWVRGDTYLSYNHSYNMSDMLRCQCKYVVTGDDIPLRIEPPLKTRGNVNGYTHCLNPETHAAAMKKEFLSILDFEFIEEDFVDYDIIIEFQW